MEGVKTQLLCASQTDASSNTKTLFCKCVVTNKMKIPWWTNVVEIPGHEKFEYDEGSSLKDPMFII